MRIVALMRFGAAMVVAILMSQMAGAAEPNQLTPEEKSQGWKLLFDGKTTDGWTSFRKSTFPAEKWVVEEGWFHCPGKGGGDIVTKETFEQFDLTWEWKLESAGNSGLKYFVVASRGPIGHEYQMLDDNKHPDAKLGDGKRVTAGFYDVLKPKATHVKPPGEINQSRILVKGNHVEHWLNGEKVLEYECGSPEIKAAVALSKFKTAVDFGNRLNGHILLQDHNNKVWFRNVKILPIK